MIMVPKFRSLFGLPVMWGVEWVGGGYILSTRVETDGKEGVIGPSVYMQKWMNNWGVEVEDFLIKFMMGLLWYTPWFKLDFFFLTSALYLCV